jgi:hypothetical protein
MTGENGNDTTGRSDSMVSAFPVFSSSTCSAMVSEMVSDTKPVAASSADLRGLDLLPGGSMGPDGFQILATGTWRPRESSPGDEWARVIDWAPNEPASDRDLAWTRVEGERLRRGAAGENSSFAVSNNAALNDSVVFVVIETRGGPSSGWSESLGGEGGRDGCGRDCEDNTADGRAMASTPSQDSAMSMGEDSESEGMMACELKLARVHAGRRTRVSRDPRKTTDWRMRVTNKIQQGQYNSGLVSDNENGNDGDEENRAENPTTRDRVE